VSEQNIIFETKGKPGTREKVGIKNVDVKNTDTLLTS
jgi:hypothetical protein